MIALILSIASATGIFVCFSLMDHWKVDAVAAVAANYTTAAVVGWIISPLPLSVLKEPWMGSALLMGSAFVFLFLLMLELTQKGGMSLGTISSQMSLLIPVALAPLLYGEQLDAVHLLGICLGLLAIYLMLRSGVQSSDRVAIKLPLKVLIVFVGTGLCTALLQFMEHHYLNKSMEIGYVSAVFVVSALVCWSYFLLRKKEKKTPITMVRSIGAGALLGLPNLGSLVFLVRALAQLDGSLVFPINNMGIVLCSSLLGSLLFRQPLTRWSIFGISSAVLGIWLISG